MKILGFLIILLIISGTPGNESDTVQAVEGKRKSGKLAFFLSFLLPGLGEYYAKAGWIRTSIPAVAELSSYASIFWIRHWQREMEKDYREFADSHYDHSRFLKWRDFIENAPDTLIKRTIIMSFLPESSVTLNYTRNELYEMIGKYDEFVQGWDDVNPDMVENNFSYIYGQNFGTDYDAYFRGFAVKSLKQSGTQIIDTVWMYYHDSDKRRPFYFGKSENQLRYMDMRADANSIGKKVMYVYYAMIINRIASAINASLAAHSYNIALANVKRHSFIDKIRLIPQRLCNSELPVNGIAISYHF